MIVPMFPLPGAFLFPGAVMPLHIFEPRYRQMVEDLLDTAGWLVVASLRADSEADGAGRPAVNPVAGLGEICRHDKLPDGRFFIALFGHRRVRLNEIDCDTPYRQVEVLPFEETSPESNEESHLRREIEGALKARLPEEVQFPEEIRLEQLVDVLLLKLGLPPQRMLPLFSNPDIGARAQAALEEHAATP